LFKHAIQNLIKPITTLTSKNYFKKIKNKQAVEPGRSYQEW
jgi:hypothetical protein